MAQLHASTSSTVPQYRQLAQGNAFQLGIGSALATVLIWSGFLLSMRAGAISALTTYDLALMRFVLPALVLLPWMIRDWSRVMATSKWVLAGIVIGAGVPFFYLSSMGASFAPAAHSGLLIPGTFPLFVTGIAVLVFKEPISKQRLTGLICIAIGVLSLVAVSLLEVGSQVWKGDLIFLMASLLWALYTLCLRLAGLPPLAITGFLCAVSSAALLVLYGLGYANTGLTEPPITTVAIQFTIQAVLVGIVAGFTYGFAINRIGAELSAALGSLTPVVVALLAIFVLHEPFTLSTFLGLGLVCGGVLLASGFSFRSVFSR